MRTQAWAVLVAGLLAGCTVVEVRGADGSTVSQVTPGILTLALPPGDDIGTVEATGLGLIGVGPPWGGWVAGYHRVRLVRLPAGCGAAVWIPPDADAAAWRAVLAPLDGVCVIEN